MPFVGGIFSTTLKPPHGEFGVGVGVWILQRMFSLTHTYRAKTCPSLCYLPRWTRKGTGGFSLSVHIFYLSWYMAPACLGTLSPETKLQGWPDEWGCSRVELKTGSVAPGASLLPKQLSIHSCSLDSSSHLSSRGGGVLSLSERPIVC